MADAVPDVGIEFFTGWEGRAVKKDIESVVAECVRQSLGNFTFGVRIRQENRERDTAVRCSF